MLAASLADISARATNEKSARSSLAVAALIDKAPSAVAKLKAKGGLVSALKVGEISAIAVRYFKTPLKADLKASVVKQVESLIAAQPSVLAAVVASCRPCRRRSCRRRSCRRRSCRRRPCRHRSLPRPRRRRSC